MGCSCESKQFGRPSSSGQFQSQMDRVLSSTLQLASFLKNDSGSSHLMIVAKCEVQQASQASAAFVAACMARAYEFVSASWESIANMDLATSKPVRLVEAQALIFDVSGPSKDFLTCLAARPNILSMRPSSIEA